MKILIIHASAGAGHTKAAEALYNHIKDYSGHKVVFADALDYTSAFYKRLYQSTYTYLITKIPWLWGLFFWVTNISWLLWLVRLLRRVFNSINARRLHSFLKKEQFDFIFSTHFFPNEVAGYLKRNRIIDSSIVCIVTDYDVHSIWLSGGIDFYAVACEHTKRRLNYLGIPRDQIIITGIPTDKKFSEKRDIDNVKEKLKIKKDVFTILIATGSFGIGPIEKIVEALKDYQVLVVCGRNKDLFKKLNKKQWSSTVVFRLVDNMHELMAVSDCMVTKPGGLSISEALVSRLPIIFFNAIPGQEEHNVRVLNGLGIGLQSHGHIPVIINEVKKLSTQKDYLSQAQKKIDKLARPSAVNDIAKIIYSTSHNQ